MDLLEAKRILNLEEVEDKDTLQERADQLLAVSWAERHRLLITRGHGRIFSVRDVDLQFQHDTPCGLRAKCYFVV